MSTRSIRVLMFKIWIRSAIPSLGKDKKWRRLGGAGSIILITAERSGANKTNDDGFRKINSEVKPLLVKDNYT